MRIQDRNNFAGTKVSAEGRCSKYRTKISLQLWEDHGEADVPLQSMEVRMEVHWKTICQSKWMPKGGCNPVGKPTLEHVCWWDL